MPKEKRFKRKSVQRSMEGFNELCPLYSIDMEDLVPSHGITNDSDVEEVLAKKSAQSPKPKKRKPPVITVPVPEEPIEFEVVEEEEPDVREKKRGRRNKPEWELQVAFVNYLEKEMPNVLFCSSMAGVYLGKVRGANCHRAGYRKGFPDFYIYETKGHYSGLFIEFKAKGRRVVKGSDQEMKLAQLGARGYCVRVIDTLESAIATVRWYMRLGMTDKDFRFKHRFNLFKTFLKEEATYGQLEALEEIIKAIKYGRDGGEDD